MEKTKFIQMARNVHGSRYNYDLLPDAFKMTDKIPIICETHGEFTQKARNHVHSKQGCPICGRLRANEKITDTFEEFIEKEKLVHGDKYEPIRDSFTTTKNKLKIRCKKCGNIFEQTGTMHLAGNGCSFCNPPHIKLTTDEFKKKLSKTHPNLEVLSEYISTNKPITVRCKVHDYTYTTTPHRLVQGANCQKCYDDRRGESKLRPVDSVINDLTSIHGDKYEYPNIYNEYKNSRSKITVVCKHGHKSQMSVNKLIAGHGCNICNESHMEREIAKMFPLAIRQQRFEWLGLQSLDFYLPDKHLAIECQGIQHMKPLEFFGGELGYLGCVERDLRKFRLCSENNIHIIYVMSRAEWKLAMSDSVLRKLYEGRTYFIEGLKDGSLNLNDIIRN